MHKYIVLMLALLLLSVGVHAQEDEITGIWQSIGYGIWFDVQEDTVEIYQTSEVSCLPLVDIPEIDYSPTAIILKDLTLAGVGQLIGAADYNITLEDGLLNFHLGKVNPIQAQRVDSLPAICDEITQDNAENTFETLWHFFNENYPFFDARGFDWQAAYDTYRPLVTAETTDEELYTLLEEMMASLGDGHVSVYSMMGSFSPIRLPDWLQSEEQLGELAWLPANYLLDEPQFLANDGIVYGYLSEDVGYISILTFEASLNGEGETNALAEAMSLLMDEFKDAKSIVMDVRYNLGGEDTNGIFIAGHFTDETQLFSHKSVWFEGEFIPIMDVYVEPLTDTPFLQDVYLLTSRMTISAAETFTLAMSTLPNVTLIGEPTNGMLSDSWFATLPNGWLVSLSNEQYLSVDNIQYEALGVPPDIEILITDETFADGHDLMLEAALALAEE